MNGCKGRSRPAASARVRIRRTVVRDTFTLRAAWRSDHPWALRGGWASCVGIRTLLAMVRTALTPKNILALGRADRPAAIACLTAR